jgi:hypothetical protein
MNHLIHVLFLSIHFIATLATQELDPETFHQLTTSGEYRAERVRSCLSIGCHWSLSLSRAVASYGLLFALVWRVMQSFCVFACVCWNNPPTDRHFIDRFVRYSTVHYSNHDKCLFIFFYIFQK